MIKLIDFDTVEDWEPNSPKLIPPKEKVPGGPLVLGTDGYIAPEASNRGREVVVEGKTGEGPGCARYSRSLVFSWGSWKGSGSTHCTLEPSSRITAPLLEPKFAVWTFAAGVVTIASHSKTTSR